jgi:hypothetical protein
MGGNIGYVVDLADNGQVAVEAVKTERTAEYFRIMELPENLSFSSLRCCDSIAPAILK